MTAITNARIFPISGPAIERGTIVIRGNRIEAVGANVAVPAGAQVIDAKGGEVYPGFIDARTSIGLNEPGPRGFDDANEMLEINAVGEGAGRVSVRQRRHSGRARQRHHHASRSCRQAG